MITRGAIPASTAIGGTGIIIVVGVALETVKELEGRMTQRSYKGLFNK
ncbi:preprotein translocase subunit SecY [Erysipelothrix rhusiopathiae SY1027]|nr:preprotein translocase subunit SecY [Erysipelothrix rhusiopathiae SY1027]